VDAIAWPSPGCGRFTRGTSAALRKLVRIEHDRVEDPGAFGATPTPKNGISAAFQNPHPFRGGIGKTRECTPESGDPRNVTHPDSGCFCMQPPQKD
jgi:hypothetical protein